LHAWEQAPELRRCPDAMLRRPLQIAPLLLALLIPAALAQPPARPIVVLHEPLPPAKGQGARTDTVVPGASGAMPSAIQTSAGTIAQPQPGKPGDDTPVYKPQPPPHVGMDRRTGADGNLHYRVVFDPSIAPFKREVSLDTVHPDVTLGQSGRGLKPIVAHQPARPGHELFWGHVRLQLQPGQRAVLPSVAPTSQILQWQSVPPLSLQFWRDDAGNFSVVSEQAGDVDLRFLMDAPSEYFAAPLGVQKRKDDPAVVPIDAALQARAEALWAPLGVTRHMERSAALSKLVEWFRSFQPGEPPEKGTDPLADLVLSQKGVCRHRALGFMVVATSLGIPVHYVMNDAHAFLEAWAPLQDGKGAWQRIDLGGGAESLELHAAKDKRLHQPQWRDPFPRPPAYTEEIDDDKVPGSAGGGQSWGGAKHVKGADFATGPGQAGPGNVGKAADQAQPAGTTGQAPPTQEDARKQWLRDRAERLAAPVQPPSLGQPPSPTDVRKPTRTTLTVATPMAWIGETLAVTGTLQAQGGKIARQPMELWLIDPAQPLLGRLLGVAVTDAQGKYASHLAIPTDADLQVYDLVARFAGDAGLLPSDSSP
jgi:hypothetical protein